GSKLIRLRGLCWIAPGQTAPLSTRITEAWPALRQPGSALVHCASLLRGVGSSHVRLENGRSQLLHSLPNALRVNTAGFIIGWTRAPASVDGTAKFPQSTPLC